MLRFLGVLGSSSGSVKYSIAPLLQTMEHIVLGWAALCMGAFSSCSMPVEILSSIFFFFTILVGG